MHRRLCGAVALLCLVMASCVAERQAAWGTRAIQGTGGEVRGTVNWGAPVSVIVSADTGSGWGLDVGGVVRSESDVGGYMFEVGFNAADPYVGYHAFRAAAGIMSYPKEDRAVALGVAYRHGDKEQGAHGFIETRWVW